MWRRESRCLHSCWRQTYGKPPGMNAAIGFRRGLRSCLSAEKDMEKTFSFTQDGTIVRCNKSDRPFHKLAEMPTLPSLFELDLSKLMKGHLSRFQFRIMLLFRKQYDSRVCEVGGGAARDRKRQPCNSSFRVRLGVGERREGEVRALFGIVACVCGG